MFDAVSCLAEAQILGTIPKEERKDNALDIENFIIPQALWWALSWKTAENMERATPPCYQEPCDPKNGTVVLIDEIDKTSADVPNGLLEALGNSAFHPQGMGVIAADKKAVSPLIVITTNGERNLPDAFIRRCLSLHLDFPKDEEQQRELLIKRGEKNFPELVNMTVKGAENKEIPLLEQAANFLIADRKVAKAKHLFPLCGQAEYFDLLRGIQQLHQQKYADPTDLLNQLRRYTLQKLEG